MKIVKQVVKKSEFENREYEYTYRLIATEYKNRNIFGIEIERKDYVDFEIFGLVRDSIEKISFEVLAVEKLFDILADNIVSPMHLVDIIGENVDKCIEELDKEMAIA